MRVFTFGAAGATAISLVMATSAMAAQPVRSATALPVSATAPTTNFRTTARLKHKSNQAESGGPALGYVLAAVVGAGTIAAAVASATDNNPEIASSPG